MPSFTNEPSQGSDTLNNSSEHTDMVAQLNAMREQNRTSQSAEQDLRAQALREMQESGVVSADPAQVEAKMREIELRNKAQDN